MKILKFFILAFLIFVVEDCYSQTDSTSIKKGEVVFPNANNFVNDNENILKFHEKIILSTMLENIQKSFGHRIVIVTVPSISPYEDLFNYSLDLARHQNSGDLYGMEVLIVLSKTLRQIQFQNSDSIRNLLTDDETKNILETFIIPEFKKGNYFIGLQQGINSLKENLE